MMINGTTLTLVVIAAVSLTLALVGAVIGDEFGAGVGVMAAVVAWLGVISEAVRENK